MSAVIWSSSLILVGIRTRGFIVRTYSSYKTLAGTAFISRVIRRSSIAATSLALAYVFCGPYCLGKAFVIDAGHARTNGRTSSGWIADEQQTVGVPAAASGGGAFAMADPGRAFATVIERGDAYAASRNHFDGSDGTITSFYYTTKADCNVGEGTQCEAYIVNGADWLHGNGFLRGPGNLKVDVYARVYNAWSNATATAMIEPLSSRRDPKTYDSCDWACRLVRDARAEYCRLHPEECHRSKKDSNRYTRGLWSGDYETGIPVVEENGLTDFVWVRGETLDPAPDSGPWNAAYEFVSEVPFTQFIIPEALPGGDSEFEIMFDESGVLHDIHAGVPFAFTDYYPDGVSGFILTGFNPIEHLATANPFPYTHGFRFAYEGSSFVGHSALLPGDYTLGGLVDDGDYSLWRTSFGLTGDHQTDGNQDGTVDAADYVLWRKWQALSQATPGVGSGAAVPEPATMCLAGMSTFSTLIVRRRRHKIRL